jgi:5-methylcytosine-specific restriction endonuclease McrA
VFEALESGRVHLTGLRLLAPHITPETVEELLAAATHKTKEAIERLLAERSPRLGVPAMVTPRCEEGAPGHLRNTDSQEVTGAGAPPSRSSDRVTPLSAESYAVQFTRSREADERFRYAQDLLGHQVKGSDIAEVYDRAVKALIEKLERVRFGACSRPRKRGRLTRPGSRHIANDVRRAVWKRDGGQCTYTSESGRRCEARRDLQFDHEQEFARGGEATVDNLRLRCPGHNQHTAEQTYGAGFMKQKREEAAAARAAAKAAKERAKAEKAKAAAASRLEPHQLEVIPWLRELGWREAECRIAVERCRDMADAPLEERVKGALRWFGARIGRKVSYAPAP